MRSAVGSAVFAVLALLYALWIGRAAWVVVFERSGRLAWPWGLNPDAETKVKFSDALVMNTAMTVGGVAMVAVGWVFWRFHRVRRFYVRKAKRNAKELARAGSILNKVVGRDQLCDILMGDLRDRRRRRPHLIIGSIGTGKTALLVRLVERLAQHNAVPVVIQLRDVQEQSELDFSELAKERFRAEIDSVLLHADEADRVWRRLRQVQDEVVVLADGLEETLKGKPDRDNVIREAIAKADDERLPLVITSRPHGALRALQAALTYLEPLSEESALEYVFENSGWRSDRRRLDWVIEAANVAESPLYLEIASDLEGKGLLEQVTGGGDELSDPHDADEWALRTDLLDAWLDALIDGDLHGELPLTPESRAMVVEQLSALACVGLKKDTAIVPLGALDGQKMTNDDMIQGLWTKEFSPPAVKPAAGGTDPYPRITRTMRERRRGILFPAGPGDSTNERRDVRDAGALQIDQRLAASLGARMGLVEDLGDGVRFLHTVMQAFLGSRFMEAFVVNGNVDGGAQRASLDKGYFAEALREPGREVLLALIFYSRRHTLVCTCRSGRSDPQCPIGATRGRLLEAADGLMDQTQRDLRSAAGAGDGDGAGGRAPSSTDQHDRRVKALEMYAAALDIDSFDEWPRHGDIVSKIGERWDLVGQYFEPEHELDSAKLALIKRMGASARLVDSHQRWLHHENVDFTAYDQMFAIGCKDSARAVRFAVAQEIGLGGDTAYWALEKELRPQPRPPGRPAAGTGGRRSVKVSVTAATGSIWPGSERVPAGEREMVPVGPPPWGERVRRKRAKERTRIGLLQEQRKERDERKGDECHTNGRVMAAWITPMLVHSCAMTDHAGSPRRTLSEWVTTVLARGSSAEHEDLALQLALAQGFKQAANNRPRPGHPDAARTFLRERTVELLQGTHFWFTRLTLLHALTLWVLRDDLHQVLPVHGHGADPAEQVKSWLEQRAGRNGEIRREQERHPLIKAAGRLACRALQSGRPDLFMWIDEAGVASQIGSANPALDEPRFHNQWIPPSTGWSTLDPLALQLLADVLVMTVLTQDRGDRWVNLQERLQRANPYVKPYLPPCLVRDRAPLDPQRTVAWTANSGPGDNCADGCQFGLCPYPPKGPDCRIEFSELFCSYQRCLLNVWQMRSWLHLRFRRRGPWQRKVSVAGLRRFWEDMGRRARDQA